jgi:hypothetical protein
MKVCLIITIYFIITDDECLVFFVLLSLDHLFYKQLHLNSEICLQFKIYLK